VKRPKRVRKNLEVRGERNREERRDGTTFTMIGSRVCGTANFRQRIVELGRKGRTPEELARQFELSAQATRN
jgi:hypothetical protein